jgi:hypothetical protein
MVLLVRRRNVEIDDAVVGLRVLREQDVLVDEAVVLGAALGLVARNDEVPGDAVRVVVVADEADLTLALGQKVPAAGVELDAFIGRGGWKRLNLVGSDVAPQLAAGELLRARNDSVLGGATADPGPEQTQVALAQDAIASRHRATGDAKVAEVETLGLCGDLLVEDAKVLLAGKHADEVARHRVYVDQARVRAVRPKVEAALGGVAVASRSGAPLSLEDLLLHLRKRALGITLLTGAARAVGCTCGCEHDSKRCDRVLNGFH